MVACMSTDEPQALHPNAAIAAVAVLQDDLRYGMYEFIRTARRPVTREQAADAVGISRKLAAFHLDKLAAAGLLRTGFQPAGGLRKVGRAPKVYVAVDADIHVSIPQRQHDVLASILVDAVLAAEPGETAQQAATRVAHDRGRRIAESERRQLRSGRLGAERALTLSEGVLARHGYEPDRVASGCVRLRNCPFHPVASQSPELVCGLNRSFLAGFLDGLDARNVEAVLEPRTGECCVELRATRSG